MSDYSAHSSNRFRINQNSPIWQGKGSFWKVFLQIFWAALRFWLSKQLWGTAVRLAHFSSPTKTLGVVVAIITIALFAWGVIGVWQALKSLGIRRLLLTFLALYLLFLSVNVLTIPDDRSILPRFISQMGRTAVSFGNTAVSTFKGIFAAPDEFLFAYTGERKLPALPPGFPTPDPQATSIIVISSANNAPQRSLRPTPTTNRAVEIIEDEGELETAVPSNSPSESQPTFPSSVSTPQSAPETDVPTEHATLIVGGYAIVVDTGSQALLARAEAGTEYEIVSRFPEGSRLIVLEGPVTADGFNWWKMRGDDGEGWCADRWLHPVED